MEWVAIPPAGDFIDPGIEHTSPASLAFAGRFFITEPPGKPLYAKFTFNSVQSLSCVRLFMTTWTAAHQASLSITNFVVYSNLFSRWCHPTISSRHPLLLLLSIFSSIRVLSNNSVLHIRRPKYWSSSFSLVLPMNIQDWFPLGSSCSSRDSQESSPTPHFKSINSSRLSFLYSPTLTSLHDYWKNHSLDQMDLCWQSNVSAFEYAI